MARLSAFKVDSKAIEAGEWVNPGDEFDGMEILTRGFTDQYTNTHGARMKRAAKGFGGDTTKLPIEIARALLVESMLAHVILDVRGLEDDAGQPVTMKQFAEILNDPAYPDMLQAAINAAKLCGQAKAADLTDAVGNSAQPSVTS